MLAMELNNGIPYDFLEAYPYPAFIIQFTNSEHEHSSNIASSSRSISPNISSGPEVRIIWSNEEWKELTGDEQLEEVLGPIGAKEFSTWLESINSEEPGEEGGQLDGKQVIPLDQQENNHKSRRNLEQGYHQHVKNGIRKPLRYMKKRSYLVKLGSINVELEMTPTILSTKKSPNSHSSSPRSITTSSRLIIITCSPTQTFVDLPDPASSREALKRQPTILNSTINLSGHKITDVHELLECTDWAGTSLGPRDQWPISLQTIVSTIMAYPIPACVWWGEDLTLIYNAGTAKTITKHPEAFGKPGSIAWSEAWEQLRPLAEQVLKGTPKCVENDFFLLNTGKGNGNQYWEQYYTWLWAPIWKEDGTIGGLFNTTEETTSKVLAERRNQVLKAITELISTAKSLDQYNNAVIESLEVSSRDIPFAALYHLEDSSESLSARGQTNISSHHERDPQGGYHTLRLSATIGIPDDHPSFPQITKVPLISEDEEGENSFLPSPGESTSSRRPSCTLLTSSPVSSDGNLPALPNDSWPISQALQTRQVILVEDCRDLVKGLPVRVWSSLPESAVVIPVCSESEEGVPSAVIIIGINLHRPLDEDYKSFLQLLKLQLASSLTSVKSAEAQVTRVEELAALDRAKTRLFTNISHELRTPLTLIKGPIDDVLRVVQDSEQVELLTLAQRNVRRLNRLVTSLMDVHRLEAQKLTGSFRPINLGILTHSLASMFEGVIGKTDLSYHVNCDLSQHDAFVDLDHWEKIVLNLISNAMKYTVEGSINVVLKYEGNSAILEIRDTGVGIPLQDLKQIGERFHRVPSTSRSHEGTGIGLSLVKELIQLHGGKFELESTTETESSDGTHGSTFRVNIPLGSDHLPPENISEGESQRNVSSTYGSDILLEADSWVSKETPPTGQGQAVSRESISASPEIGSRRRPEGIVIPFDVTDTILVVDDSPEIRQYLRSIFSPHCRMIEARDGQEALDICNQGHPELIISDVMMPKLDGFGLLQSLKSSPLMKSIPVIMLTARRGDESKVDGLLAGAEDYLAKPFNAQELLTRAHIQILLGKKRKQLEQTVEAQTQELRAILDYSPVGLFRCDQNGALLSVNTAWYEISGHPGDGNLDEWTHLIDESSMESVVTYWGNLFKEETQNTTTLDFRLKCGRWVTAKMTRLDFAEIGITGFLGCLTDITDRVAHEEAHKERVIQAEQRRLAAEEAKLEQELLIDITSHEIRNPISSVMQIIKTNLAAIEEQLEACLNDGSKFKPTRQLVGVMKEDLEALESIYQCGLAQERICNDVLSLGRIQLDMLQMFDVQINLHKEAQKAISIFQSEARMKRITLSLNMGDSIQKLGIECIKIDPVRLGQVLTNLLSNGIRFTSNSAIRRIELSFDLSYERPTDDSCAVPTSSVPHSDIQGGEPIYLYVSVTDSGPGMTPAELNLLFQRFSQVSPKTHTIFGGSGLGLFVCRKITDIMGGRIEVLSEQGKGSTFRFFVEARTCENQDISPHANGSTSKDFKPVRPSKLIRADTMIRISGLTDKNAKPRILIVEDNLINQTVLARQLKHVGFSVEVANNGLEALEKIRKVSSLVEIVDNSQFDCVIMDLEMPIMDGLTAVGILREEESAGSLTRSSVVALTGNARQGQIDQAKEHGMDDVIIKPYRLDDLLAKIEDMMRLRLKLNP